MNPTNVYALDGIACVVLMQSHSQPLQVLPCLDSHDNMIVNDHPSVTSCGWVMRKIETNQQNLRVPSSRSISRYHHYPSCSNHTKLVPHSNFSLQIFRLTVKNRFCFTATKTRGLATRDQDRERLHTTTVCPID